jgi:multidrug efflux pump subunit AcrA (membrane-fusion protein)
MFRLFAAACRGAALLFLLCVGSLSAHEGHDHAEQAAAPPQGSAARAESTSADFELVAVAGGAELLFYLDRFATNEPVEGATLEVETPEGPAKAEVEAGGPYRLKAPWLAKPGKFELTVAVTAGDTTDILPISLQVTPGTAIAADDSPSPSERIKALLPVPVLLALLAGLVLGALLTGLLRRPKQHAALLLGGMIAASLLFAPLRVRAHEGHSHDEDKSAPPAAVSDRAQRLPGGIIFAPKPVQRIFAIRTAMVEAGTHRRSIELPGRIIPDPNASGFVQAAVGGRLSAPPGGFPRLGTPVKKGDVLAYVTPPLQAIDVSDMRQRQGELDQQIAIVERRVGRFEQLIKSGAVSGAQLEESRLELQGLRERRASLDKVRRDAEALVAPVDGVIADGAPVAGQIAQPNAVIYHIVDPGRLWVEALSFNPVEAQAASAVTASGKTLSLVPRGSGFADRSQSIPIHFAIEGDTGGLRAGQFVTVLVASDDERKGLAVPRTSLVRSTNGQDFVYEHIAAERFAPRAVRAEPLDGERVLIAAGIEPGRRIVVQGAELLDHVR